LLARRVGSAVKAAFVSFVGGSFALLAAALARAGVVLVPR
jgi:hypothetical protein